MQYLLFAFGVLGALVALTTFFPSHSAALSALAFVVGWTVCELPFFFIFLAVISTSVLIFFGGLSSPIGYIGFALACLYILSLVAHIIIGKRSAEIISAEIKHAFNVETHLKDGLPGSWLGLFFGFPTLPKEVEVVRNIDYAGDGIYRHLADVYQHKDISRRNGVVVLYIHGGAWVIGDKKQQARPMIYTLAKNGYTCVEINYRLSPKATWPDHIVDVKRAIVWIKENIERFGANPEKIIISGGSAGGHLASLAALSINDPQFQPDFEDKDTTLIGAVTFYGVMDLTNSTNAQNGQLQKILEKRVLKNKLNENRQLWENASPMFKVRKDAPPFLIFQGATDTLVPSKEAKIFAEKLKATSSNPVGYIELPYTQHGFEVLWWSL